MKTTAEKIAVMQAHEDGKDIEWKLYVDERWDPAPEPCWNWLEYDYRVKREPQKAWLLRDPKNGELHPDYVFYSPNEADKELYERKQLYRGDFNLEVVEFEEIIK